jgi:hypothetical protein
MDTCMRYAVRQMIPASTELLHLTNNTKYHRLTNLQDELHLRFANLSQSHIPEHP